MNLLLAANTSLLALIFVIFSRCYYVWRQTPTFWMFSRCWRAEANFTLFSSMFQNTCIISVNECWVCHDSLFCTQCAHGRPTTVPLVNLNALHTRILQLGSWSDLSKNTWRGLCRKEISLDRAKRRLDAARGSEWKTVLLV